ncbi:hypothetical protein [Comamonas aquatica]|uniref:hypothetical protein n=1 Tax=Comamonas aquatica TaxID=225991 RepID=UPI0021B10503|nr:hypothetical protein [Comamonas aquatica]
MSPVYRWLALSACGLGLLACSDFQERLGGYPTTDTVLHLDSASSNQIADALNQLSRIAVLGAARALPCTAMRAAATTTPRCSTATPWCAGRTSSRCACSRPAATSTCSLPKAICRRWRRNARSAWRPRHQPIRRKNHSYQRNPEARYSGF